jgi:mono/diheme cytochrome c family protein
MLRTSVLAVLFGSLSFAAAAADIERPGSRAQLLYETHCGECHTAKLHWRKDKLATDWSSLKAQVDRWQNISGLRWSEQDIADVAFYLNILHYNYPVKD